MLHLLVVFIPTLLLAEEGGQEPKPIAALLSFALMVLIVYLIIARSRRKSRKYKLTGEHRQRPPTDRQMDYIDTLMEEREVKT